MSSMCQNVRFQSRFIYTFPGALIEGLTHTVPKLLQSGRTGQIAWNRCHSLCSYVPISEQACLKAQRFGYRVLELEQQASIDGNL